MTTKQALRMRVSTGVAAVAVAFAAAAACGGAVTPNNGGGPADAQASSGSSSGAASSGCCFGSSGGSASSSSSGSSSGVPEGSPVDSSSSTSLDGSAPIDAASWDGSTDFDVQPAPAGLAGFAFVVNGIVQTPLACAAESWEYPPPAPQAASDDAGLYGNTVCNGGVPPCPGMGVFLVNTGQFPVAYTAQTTWDISPNTGQPPGVQFGNAGELSGVLDPGEQVDITSVYVGGITAVLGSSQPFIDPDAGKYAADGATIPWPAGVAGSEGSSQMYVAEIEIADSCHLPSVAW